MAVRYLPRINPADEAAFRRILGTDFPRNFGAWYLSRKFAIEAGGDECMTVLVLTDEFEMFIKNRPDLRTFDGLRESTRCKGDSG
jgi:hypothetical protein